MTKLKKRWAIAVAGLFLFLLAGYFALTRVADHYLQDGGLARAIGKKTAFILKADAGYLPLFWRGLTVRSDGLLVRGGPGRALTALRAENLRASCGLQDLWQRKFVINRLQADRLEVAFGAASAQQLAPILPAQPALQPQMDPPSPLKLEIRETIVQRMALFWGGQPEALGAVREVLAKFYPNGSALDTIGTGGTLRQTGWPELRIIRVETHYDKPRLEIRNASFAIGKEADTSASGLFDLSENGGMFLIQFPARGKKSLPKRGTVTSGLL